jgi:hypothetical protein
MNRFYPKFFLSALLTKLLIAQVEDEGDYILCQECTKIKFSGYESMQRDIRQENRLNTLTISERQKMYLKFLKNTYQDCRILTPQQIELLFIKM